MAETQYKSAAEAQEDIPENDKDLIKEALEEYDEDMEVDKQNVLDSLDDLKHYVGEQWDPQVKSEREADGRPCLTINKFPQYVRQVTNDIRLNKPSIKVSPFDDGTDPELAETMEGLIRSIEGYSNADEAYITAAESAARCGVGHWRILTDYVDEYSREQDILIQRILNPFAVVWDAYAIEATRSDARHCFVKEQVGRKAFPKLYPEAKISEWDSGDYLDLGAWIAKDAVTVAEYFKKKLIPKEIAYLRDGSVYDLSITPPDVLNRIKPKIFDTRKTYVTEVCWYKMTVTEILERGKWVGKHIPIISVFGEEVYVENRTVRAGIIRHAKDPQRLYNLWRSAQTEQVALQPKAPFMVTPDQIKGYTAMWNAMGSENRAYMVYNPDQKAQGAPQRQAPPQQSPGMTEAVMTADADMHSTTGIYPPSLGQRSNETSGKAITARQYEGDVSTFMISDNLRRAIRWSGVVIADAVPKVFDTERIKRVLGEDGKEKNVILAPSPSGKPITLRPKNATAPLAGSTATAPSAYPVMAAVGPVPGPGRPPGAGAPTEVAPGPLPAADGAPVPGEGLPSGPMPPTPPPSNVVPFPAAPPVIPEAQYDKVYDLSAGKYDIRVDSGPSFSTKRQEAAASMSDLVRAAPQLMGVAGDILVRNLDWPGAEELSDRLRKTLPPGLAEPQEGDPPPAPPPPNPEQIKADATLQQIQAEGQIKGTEMDAKRDLANMEAALKREEWAHEKEMAQIKASPATDPQAAQMDYNLKMVDLKNKELELELKREELEFRKLELSETIRMQEQEHGLKSVSMAGDAMVAGTDIMGTREDQQHEQNMAGHEAAQADAQRQHEQGLADQASADAEAQRQHEQEMAAQEGANNEE